jgi:electron transfer flavoprotein beta subunit
VIVVAIKCALGMSEPDAAALETALGLDDAWSAGGVTVVSAGPPAVDHGLREALAAGAREAVRIDVPSGLRSDAVARALAPRCAGAAWVLCGDASADRGSGSVPGFLAAELGIGQALGLVGVDRRPDGGLRVVRRLDGGRREVLTATSPTVLSVEGSVARLRRASLPAELAAQRATIVVVAGPDGPVERPASTRVYRPRPRALAMPTGDAFARIGQLTDAGTSARRDEVVALEPDVAARRIVDTLRAWGYLGDGPSDVAS